MPTDLKDTAAAIAVLELRQAIERGVEDPKQMCAGCRIRVTALVSRRPENPDA